MLYQTATIFLVSVVNKKTYVLHSSVITTIFNTDTLQ